GFGPSVFGKAGLQEAARPAELDPIPPFPGDQLDPSRSNGDLGVIIAADDPLVVQDALRVLTAAAQGVARQRWGMPGFRPVPAAPANPTATQRNLLGFLDGTNNPRHNDPDFDQKVFVTNGPPWMVGGSYVVIRRIRMLTDAWDQLDDHAQ